MQNLNVGQWTTSILLALIIIAPIPGHANALESSRVERPNVILILTDDQGFGDVGFNDNEKINTPHLDRFAREGLTLDRFYCSPVCAPTRACLMTGRHYYRTGVVHTSRGGAKMHGDEITIAEQLADAGYATGIFGKWHLGDNYPMRPQDQGFQESLIHKSGGIGQTPDKPNSYFDAILWKNGEQIKSSGYCTDVFFDGAINFIDQQKDQPFFIYLPTNAPHTPLEISDQYAQPYRDAGLDDTTARVYGMVENIDDNMGRLLQHLEKRGLRQNTFVIFFGDNGPQQKRYTGGLRGRKSWSYEGGIRVPCCMQWPDKLVGGRRIQRIAAHLDIAPTLLDACQIEPSTAVRFDGINIMPTLEDNAESPSRDRTLFFQCHRGLIPKPYQNCAVVTQRYKLVGYPGTFSDENLVTNEPILELYDIEQDSEEEHNIAAQLPEVFASLKSEYEAWFQSVSRSRNFTPGLIVVGTQHENPSHLCRYQDGTYVDGTPHGWSVKVATTGLYRMTVNVPLKKRGRVFVQWRDKTLAKTVTPDEPSADFQLEAGQGTVDIWYQAHGEERIIVSDNSTTGDVTLELLHE